MFHLLRASRQIRWLAAGVDGEVVMDAANGRGKKGTPSSAAPAPAAARKAVRLMAAVVFLGWLVMWVMLPTKTYTSTWAPKIATLTNSIYLGKQGTRIVIFVLPVLSVYVIACLYLHLLKRSDPDTQSQKRGVMAAWRRPVLVRGPLGIVTGVEVAFFLVLLALLIWCYSSFIRFEFSKIRVKQHEKLWQAELEKAARRLGTVGSLCVALLFFPVARGSSLLPLVGLTSESSIKYHVWLGHLAMVIFTAHGLCYIFFWASTDQIHEMAKWARTRASNVAGELALLSGLVIWATALPRIRRQMFELFYYAHHLYIPLIVLCALHIGISVFCYILPGVFVFMVDRCLRFMQSRSRVRLLSARLLPSGAVQLNFSKNPCLRYNPTSTLFINVPCVSRLQWHPFTVTSSSGLEPDRLSVVIKKSGSWTQKLYDTVSSLPPSAGHLDISVEGPYSPATTTRLLGYDSLVMVSGGSGITPFISITRELLHRSGTPGTATPSLLLICVFKSSADLDMLDLLIPETAGVFDISRLGLRIEAFVTGESDSSTGDAARKLPSQELWFKPGPSEAAIAPVLGPNSWLWLAAIVSSSFVIFLALMAALQRLCIYPVDGDSNHVYPWAAKTVLNLLLLCVSVAGTTGATFMWNRRKSSWEAKQIKDVDVPTPGMSPASWLQEAGGVDRELESMPTQPLAQATTAHFGRRPDLKRMLVEIDGENIGVIASGPPGLVKDIAAICSSEQGNNMHFESISFCW